MQICLITHNNYINLLMLSFQNREEHQKKETLHQMTIQKAANLKYLTNQKFKKIQFRENRSLNLSHQQYNSLPRGVPDLPEISRRQSDTIEVDKDHEIYFNRNKKYNYMKKIIDKYFEQTKGEKFYSRSKYNSEELSKTNIYRTIGSIDSSKNNTKSIIEQRKLNPRRLIELRRKVKQQVDNQQEEDLNSTLSHSRLIQNNQQETEIGRNLSFSTKSNYNLLPTIDEMYQDKEQNVSLIRYESISYINDSQAEQVKETKFKMLENQIYCIELVLKNNIPSHKIKTYKQKGQALLGRELKAHSMGVESTWIQYKYDQRCLISNTNPSLKQLLFKAKKVDAQAKFFTLKQKKYYSKLIYNNCQQLKRIIRQFCIFMKKNQSRIANNKINTGNIFINKNQNFRLGEWGFSSFRETHIIQNMEFENRIEPIIKSQKEWFIPPEYIAPEIIKAIAFNQETDPMNLGSAADRWSLGVMIFEILTLIPVWIPQKCMIHGKTMVARSGILAVPQRDLKKLLKREQKMPYIMRRVLQQQFEQSAFDQSLVYVMLNCVQFEPEQRLSYDEIIQKLK